MQRIELPRFLGILAASVLIAVPLSAQDDEGPRGSVEQRLQIIEEELERQKLDEATREYESVGGMGPAASAVYNQSEGLTWGGYGEVKHRDYRSSFKTDESDVHRMVLYAGYRFNDWIVLNTEFEYEHAGFVEATVLEDAELDSGTLETESTTVNESEVFVEFAYVDFEFAKWLQLQLGLVLVPSGITNYMHEPTTFLAVERPYSESNIIPGVWRDIGAVVHGEFGDLVTYRVGGLGGQRATNFSSGSWIRGGRQKGSEALTEDWAGVASIDFHPIEGLTLGGSYYVGDSGQGEIAKLSWTDRLVNPLDSISDGTGLKAAYDTIQSNRNKNARIRVHIAEGHLLFNRGPVMARALAVQGWMSEDDARAVNAATGKNIGMHVEGAYGELGFDVLSFFDTSHRLYPFVRYEYVNTQKETVQRYRGGEEDINDYVCSVVLIGTCKTTSDLSNGNRSLGIISASDSADEAYGVTGVPDRVNDRRIFTTGVAYFPHPQVVIKADYERWMSKSNHPSDIAGLNSSNNKIDRINFAVGFIF